MADGLSVEVREITMTFTLNLPQLIEVYLLGAATVTTILLAIQVIRK